MGSFFKKLLCFFAGHDWSATWHGQDWYEYGWKTHEAILCRRCGHPGLRYENGRKLPLSDNAQLLGPIK